MLVGPTCGSRLPVPQPDLKALWPALVQHDAVVDDVDGLPGGEALRAVLDPFVHVCGPVPL